MDLFTFESITLFKHLHKVILFNSMHCPYVCQFVYLLVCLLVLTSVIMFFVQFFFLLNLLYFLKTKMFQSPVIKLNKRLCPLICLSAPQPICLSVYPSVSPLVPPYHFTWRVKTKITSDYRHAYGVVINPKMVSQESLSANLYVCQSICLSLKSAAHASYHDLQLDIRNTNGGFTEVFFYVFL